MTPRRSVAVLGLALTLVAGFACGKYGPPVRSPSADASSESSSDAGAGDESEEETR
ncbi:MAG: hypothetical protein V3T01_04430 [Myxococcota bacterium]